MQLRKSPTYPFTASSRTKRHFVVKDKNTLILSNLRKLEIGKAFALDNEDDWTGRVKSRNDEQGYLILYIHNKSQRLSSSSRFLTTMKFLNLWKANLR